METLIAQSSPGAPLAGAGEGVRLDEAENTAQQTGRNTASLDSAAVDGVRADIGVPPQDRLIELQLDDTADFRDLAGLSEDAHPSFHDDDLPAPAFHENDLPSPSFHDDDLPAPSFHDDDLPAPSVHDYDMPADLMTFGLDRLLGLQLSSAAPPTVGEVILSASPPIEAKESEPKEAKNDGGNDKPPAQEEEANSEFSDAGDVPFIDPQAFTERAEANNAKSASGEHGDAKLFRLGFRLFDENEDDELNFDFFDLGDLGNANANASANSNANALLHVENGGGGGNSGGGTNVINGTAGDDVLIGTAGSDLIHGFAGNDIIDGGAGSDRLDGGQGDDVLIWDSADTKIDGKNGTDTLRVDGGDANFTTFGGTMSGLEIVDLQSDDDVNILTLTAQDVLDVTDKTNTLTITGKAGDILIADNGWTDGGIDVGGNQIYTKVVGAFTATLVVDPDITPQTPLV